MRPNPTYPEGLYRDEISIVVFAFITALLPLLFSLA